MSSLPVNNFLTSFLSETGETERGAKLIQFLHSFLITVAEGKDASVCFKSSDPHSVLNLLVQDLLTRFSHTFLDNPLSQTLEIDSLKKFLCQEDILLLLATIYHICMQVNSAHIELVELLIVVLRNLVNDTSEVEVGSDLFFQLNPIYAHSQLLKSKLHKHSLSNLYHKEQDPLRSLNFTAAIGPETVEWISIAFLNNQTLCSNLNDSRLLLLLLGVVEGLSCRSPPKNSSQLSACLQILFNLTDLLEELMLLWLQARNNSRSSSQSGDQPSSYLCITLFSRFLLRVWFILASNSTSPFLSPSHIADLQVLLPRPITMVTNISMSLSKDWLFKENRTLDAEFTFLFLESLYVSFFSINTFVSNPLVPAESFLTVLQSSLYDSSQEWLVYVCSKLQSMPRNSTRWDLVIDSTHLLLSWMTREMILISDAIHSCQQAAKSQLLMQHDTAGTRPVSYSLETSLGFDKLEQRLCKISQSLLSIFDTTPNIQLLALQLLAQTGLDKVGIISDFLPRVSHSSVWSMPEVLDLYLELLEKAWFQLSPDYAGSVEFWSKVHHYVTPLLEGSCQTVLQVMYHLLFLFSHSSLYLKSALTQHVLVKYHQEMVDNFKKKISVVNGATEKGVAWSSGAGKQGLVKVDFEIEEENVFCQYLKLVQKMASHPSSLVLFLENSKNLYSLFLFLPITRFRLETLSIFGTILKTLCTPWEASIVNSNKLSRNSTHFHLVNSLLQLAFEFREGTLVSRCNQLSLGRENITSFNLRQVDEVHIVVQGLIDCSTVSDLVRSSLVEHLSLINDIWGILAHSTATCDVLISIMNDNHIWDVIQVLAPSLAGLLERLQQWYCQEKGGMKDDKTNLLVSLQETCVSLLCHLLTMATIMCRAREDPLKVLEFHCSEVHSFLKGSRLCVIPNSHLYIATLFKTACYYSQDPEKPAQPTSQTTQTEPPRRTNSCSDQKSNLEGSPVISRRQSKIRPLALPLDVKLHRKPVRRVNPAVTLSPSNGLRVFYPMTIDVVDNESDNSGYEGDTELGMGRAWWDGEAKIGEEEEKRVAGGGVSLHSPVTTVKVPEEVKRRLWLEKPIWQSLELLNECLEDEITAEESESCVEVFLVYLLALLKADNFNLSLLAGKGLLGSLLDTFSSLFESQTERSKNCWLVMCQIAEVLATYQVSQSDVRKLLLKLQKNKEHLEQLVCMLQKVAEVTHTLQQPSSYIKFSYPRPAMKLKHEEMLAIPNPRPMGLEPCTLSVWLNITRYPLKAYYHLFAIFTGEVYVQMWACACSGDITITLSNQLQLTCLNETPLVSSLPFGSVLPLNNASVNSFHHIFFSVKRIPSRSPQYQIVLVINGGDVYDYHLNLPSTLAKNKETQCFIAGGVVSHHTAEKHIRLVHADHTELSWKLGSLHILEGFCSINLASILYQLGPECAPSNIPQLKDILTPIYLEVANDTIINNKDIGENELRALQWPYISYSAHHSQKVFLVTLKEYNDDDTVLDSSHIFRIPSVHHLQWVSSVYAISQPQLLDVLQSCIGLEQLIYLYAKCVSEGCSERCQHAAISLIYLAANHSPITKLEFHQLGGVKLLQQVLRTSKAILSGNIANVFLDWCCGSDRLEVKNIEVLEHILLDWHIWHRAPVEVWKMLLSQLEELLNPENSHQKLNHAHFAEAKALVKILLTSKERSLDRLKPLDGAIAMMFVRLVSLLLGDPPDVDCLKYIWDHLLLPDLNDLKILRGAGTLEATISFVEASHLANEGHDSPRPSLGSLTTLDSHSASRLGETFLDYHDEVEDEEDDSEPEVLEFDIQSREGRLPDSSYTDEETVFTWTDITGLPFLNDADNLSTVPATLETGLLSVMRKIICLLPDSQVRRVLGPILDQESIVVMANNSSILVRTAVIRVLDEFFRRAGESTQANFLQIKGFNLLSMQLKQYSVSFELMSALFSIIFGQEINLKDQATTFQMPRTLTGFQLHAVIPVLVCAPNTITDSSLCHSTLIMLKELFEMVKGMPLFMLNNGLYKMLCQMIALTLECSLSRENRQAILNDLLSFCKLVVIFTVSAENLETYQLLESFLVCLRHCSDEFQKTKGPQSLTVVYLEQFIYLVLAEALLLFSTGPIGDGGIFTPLESCQQVANQSELNNRFVNVCSVSVDWIVHGVEPFTSDHALLFAEGHTIPKVITFDRKALAGSMTTSFVRFVIHYFYRAILSIVKKNSPLNFEISSQRFFVNSRTQLNDSFSRLFGHLICSIHDSQFRAEILKEVWSLEDFSSVLLSLFTSTYKKLLSCRLVVTVVDLMQSRMDSQLLTTCNEVYEVVCSSGTTRLKHGTRLSSLLNIRDEEDHRTRQKTETIMEDLQNSDQRWIERVEAGNKDFENRQMMLYRRLMEKSKHREQAVSRASAQVTDQVFMRQRDLRKNFIEQIHVDGVWEKEMLHKWRKIIMANTHSRALWSNDERRPLCWQLDSTEGPSRVRRRLMKAPRYTDEKFLLSEAQIGKGSDIGSSPLSFIFEETAYDSTMGLVSNIVLQEGERIISNYNQRCSVITPDSCCFGDLLISNICCYFKGDVPLGDPNITKVVPCDEKTQLLSWRHIDVVEIHRRRYMLKDNALEIFLINGVTTLLSFDTTWERDKVHNGLLGLDILNLVDSGDGESGKLRMVTLGWQQGEITNFEYLMELNKLAGRTFNDLMQYPVFPFILSDYTSEELDLTQDTSFRKLEKPISIQDDTKIQKYIDTYNYLQTECANRDSMMPGLTQLSSKPYHYGSHYSNSGIVLHFLVRVPPFTNMFLDFQGKSFDIADRSFHNMATTWWLSSSESATDVKELIPEFFYFPEFLTNAERFNFGVKQSGEVVDDVILPPWANGDPRLFILKHRQALESEYVSRHLHEWIDLVFGFKQTGKAAVQSINVFHPATYYGVDGIDVDAVADRTQQEAMKTMVKTYGQMPQQLFRDPHPLRSKSTVRTTLLIRFGTVFKRLTSSSSAPLKVSNPYILNHMQTVRPKVNTDSVFIGKPGYPVHRPAHTVNTTISPENLTCLWNGEVAVTELKACLFPSASQMYNNLLVTWGHWDNALVIRVVGMESSTIRLHHPPLNKVTCCQCVCNEQIVVSAGSAGVVSFWKLDNLAKKSLRYTGQVVHLRGHDGPINCLVSCKFYSIVVSGSADGTCIIWDTNRLCYVNSLSEHEGPVTCLAISPTLGDIVSLCMTKREDTTSVQRSQSCVLCLWTINGRLVKKLKSDVQILSLCYTSAPEGVYVNVIIGGLANGRIKFWSSWDLSELCELTNPTGDPAPVLSLAVSSCSTKLYAGYSNMQVVTWIKPETDPDETNGDYVVVPSFLAPPPTSAVEKMAQSTSSILKYF